MSVFTRNIPLLAFCQAMEMRVASLLIASAALVGLQLADDKSLSTIPLAIHFYCHYADEYTCSNADE